MQRAVKKVLTIAVLLSVISMAYNASAQVSDPLTDPGIESHVKVYLKAVNEGVFCSPESEPVKSGVKNLNFPGSYQGVQDK